MKPRFSFSSLVHDRLHTRVRAPQGDDKPKDEAESQLRTASGGQPPYLFAQDIDGALRENSGKERELLADRGGTREQSIQRNQRGHGRKNR